MWNWIKSESNGAIFCLILAPYLLPSFYKLKMDTGVFRLDLYLIWILGLICLLSNKEPDRPSRRGFRLVIGAVLGYFILAICLHPLEEGVYYAGLTTCSLVFIVHFLRNIGPLCTEAIIVFSFPAYVIQLAKGFIELVHDQTGGISINADLYNSGFYGNYLLYGISFLFVAANSMMFRSIFRLLCAAGCVIVIILIISTRARAAIFGAIVSVLIASCFFRRYKPRLPEVFVRVIVVGALSFFGLYFLSSKLDSVSGRMTIYKVCQNILRDHWLLGVGPSRFGSVFNSYQADYLHQPGISTYKQSLADNTFEAFNILLQLWIEYGLIGLLIVTGLGIFVSWKLWLHRRVGGDSIRIARGCLGAVAGVITAGMFSNPFHITPVILNFCFCIGFVLAMLKHPRQITIEAPRAEVFKHDNSNTHS